MGTQEEKRVSDCCLSENSSHLVEEEGSVEGRGHVECRDGFQEDNATLSLNLDGG